jgi:hypothetical protein
MLTSYGSVSKKELRPCAAIISADCHILDDQLFGNPSHDFPCDARVERRFASMNLVNRLDQRSSMFETSEMERQGDFQSLTGFQPAVDRTFLSSARAAWQTGAATSIFQVLFFFRRIATCR